MTTNKPKRIGILTSGGDAPGMNAAIRAVVRAAIHQDVAVTGIRDGFNGIFAENFIALDARAVGNTLQYGGTFLGTGRSARFQEPDGPRDAAAILKKRGIDALVAIGGNGTYAGLAALHRDTGFRAVGIPGSIDNDVGGTDFSIGFDTAVNTALDAIDRIRDTAFSLARVFFVEVMGRACGQIAAAVGLAGGASAVVVPELPVDIAGIAADIERGLAVGKQAAIIVVAEGDITGGAADVAARVRAAVKHDLNERVMVLGYIQRGGKPTANDRILAAKLGVRAVQALRDGDDPCVVGVRCSTEAVTPLAEAAQASSAPVLGQEVQRLAAILSGIPESAAS